MRRFGLAYLAPAALMLGFVVAPLATGVRTLFLRDTLLTHAAMREGLAQAVRAGELPLIDPLRGGGQALLGNLNAVALYPDNVLLLFASNLWQLNAHFWLHWIAAAAAAFWMARAFGWGRPAAAATAVAYAFSGYFVSQLNLYNGVAPAALAPALIAAAAELAGGARPRRGFVALALLWALSLLGGDPIVAALALAVALAGMVALRAGSASAPSGGLSPRPPAPRGWLAAAAALACGTALAAPQLLATRAILGESYRGFRGFDAKDLAVAAPEPAALLELLLPLFFGRPDSGTFWGNAYFGATPPLYFSLAPGALALALGAVGLAVRRPLRGFAALLAGAGLVLTFSAGTFVTTALAAVPGMGLVRFQAKFALLFALGAALLAGLGAEAVDASARGRSLLRRSLAALAIVELAFVLFCAARPAGPFAAFVSAFAGGLPEGALAEESRRWTGVALLSVFALLLALLAASRRLERFALALPAVVALQAGLQLLLLRGIVPTDEASFYRRPPPVFESIPPSARLVHGAVNQLFGSGLMETPGADPRLAAQVRRAWLSGFNVAAHAAGRKTELDSSPEGLDHFTLLAAEDAVEILPDAERLRLLRATGVDRLLLPRALDGAAATQAKLARTETELEPPLRIYELEGWGPLVLADCVSSAPHMNAALARLVAADFDPRREAVVPGSAEERCAPAGEARSARLLSDERELVEVEAVAPSGGVLVLARAFLPIWRAEIDGRPARTVVAQMTRLAVELPEGTSAPRRVRIFVDRGPLRIGCAIAAAAAIALALLARSRLATARPAA